MNEPVNRQWRLVARPEGGIEPGMFEWREAPLPALADGKILVRTVYLSLDPASRMWLDDEESYLPPVAIGDVMRGVTLGIVSDSAHPDFSPGDVVQGVWGWQEYAVLAPEALRARVPKSDGLPLTAYMAVVGNIGFTAYFGLLDVGRPRPGETVVVTAAAGAVGSLVGQIAKIEGCRAVGIAGNDEKCRWIKEELGYDAAINYKTEDVPEALARHCPNGVDVVFENVGGAILDHVLGRINVGARIALCGLIAQYNARAPVPGPYMFRNVLLKRATIQGFIILDYAGRFGEAREALVRWLGDGRLKYRVDIVDGLENAPAALTKLFDGSNAGKLMIAVSEEPAA